eukprot:CAMPEP_0206263376 /NCGR_PEP_ID=MMETSP0047_2-20121206/28784_1 /ASSEMBLY_ACC=CAM_ASM_000192 /TAXON_ID=195065 /ORGANISM="Chroomonas mesostigmatica_cf, Strain CCMP1168" /LENGTH=63 /DNA_ID=CAMNT_0053690911 /DNA_START=99 /DNA_END=286 /DNA_ORIENTATION=-
MNQPCFGAMWQAMLGKNKNKRPAFERKFYEEDIMEDEGDQTSIQQIVTKAVQDEEKAASSMQG